MGYNTYFAGEFDISKPLGLQTIKRIAELDDNPAMAFMYSGLPERYNPWTISDDGKHILSPEESGKYYGFDLWLEFIVRTFIVATGRTATGAVEWDGEDTFDIGVIILEVNDDGEQLVSTAEPVQTWQTWPRSPVKILLSSGGQSVKFPIPFEGSAKQKGENLRSHDWRATTDDEGQECFACASRDYHVAATYMCGTVPARKEVLI